MGHKRRPNQTPPRSRFRSLALHLDDAPMIERYGGIEKIFPPFPERRQRACFILFDEPAVTDNVSGEDRGEPAVIPVAPPFAGPAAIGLYRLRVQMI